MPSPSDSEAHAGRRWTPRDVSPMPPALASTSRDAQHPPIAPLATGMISPMPRDSRGTVLVVDDERTIVEVVARYLARAGFATREAFDGPGAVEAARGDRPDLVVLDVMLPGFDGIEVMRRLHEQPGEPVPVILLTARGEESDRLIGLRRGADDYVVKPFSPAELVARVEAVLRRAARAGG